MNMDSVWTTALDRIFHEGVSVAPAGKMTLEVPHQTIELDMRYPVLTVPERKLGYRFMAAEAFWMLTGDDRVESIAPYSKRIGDFSDDGATFFGAYGPKIIDQMPYVIETLTTDPFSRRAVINIWRENPTPTKDYPCTICMTFMIRDGLLNAHVFMRSNDIWLGMPYDCFNFSMVAHMVCCHLNETVGELVATPGRLYMTAASSHLYQQNWQDGFECSKSSAYQVERSPTPENLYTSASTLINTLRVLREINSNGWWRSE